MKRSCHIPSVGPFPDLKQQSPTSPSCLYVLTCVGCEEELIGKILAGVKDIISDVTLEKDNELGMLPSSSSLLRLVLFSIGVRFYKGNNYELVLYQCA